MELCIQPLPRVSPATMAGQVHSVTDEPTVLAMIEAMAEPVAILNDSRQIVAANRAFFAAIGTEEVSAVIGQRPGEALGCVEASRGADGCGTATACQVCGGGRCLAEVQQGVTGAVQAECLITRRGSMGDEALEFLARANRLPTGWTVFTLHDIGHEKRRRILERCFFHDLLNSATGVQSLAELVADGDTEFASLLTASAGNLVDEIRHHRLIDAAEHGTLTLSIDSVDLAQVAREVSGLFARSPLVEGRRLTLTLAPAVVRTDRVLARRVLVNLVKNALEATPTGGTVEIRTALEGGAGVMAVRNPGEMPFEVRLQLFRRSFSTKSGVGRGIGTWSVKLLVERYLEGRVAFTVADGATTFTVRLP